MDEPKPVFLKNRAAWRRWLKSNGGTVDHIWLGHYKKHTNTPGLSHEDALDEALCFGWIDGKLKSMGPDAYMLRYSPRRKNSPWSMVNRTKAERLIEQRRMAAPGLEKIAEARANGMWDAAYSSKEAPALPPDLKRALKSNKNAWINFQGFANCYQNTYISWVNHAKQEPTRLKRIKDVVQRSAQNIKPGM